MPRLRTRHSDFSSTASTPLTSSPGLSSASSSTSLSSLNDDELAGKPEATGKPLLDTYGNVFEVPDFTFKQIRDAIPKHCFERSALRGFGYIARDLALIATAAWTLNYSLTALQDSPAYLRGIAYAVYGILCGMFGTGIWILAHECGHQAFSESRNLNDFVGWVLHSALLVPFFSWKLSHHKHHASTGNIEKDMAWVPATRFEYARGFAKNLGHDISELCEETPIATLFHTVVVQQLLGWFIYLTSNHTGHNFHARQKEGRGKDGKRNGFGTGVSHFDPRSPIYEAKEAHLIVYSDIGIAITGAILYFAVQKWGFANVMLWYGVPYLGVNHWIVAITFLQHTDPSLPHYYPESWNYARGAAATIDREFGFIGRHLMHGIVETHVLHHFVPLIPFYHADEATEAIKKVMGNHYRSDTTGGPWGFMKAIWTTARWCQWVEESEGAEGEGKGVVFFRNRNNLGTAPLAADKVIPRVNEIRNLISLGKIKEEELPFKL